MKIVVASDNHGNISALRKIVFKHPNADYYWHLGDSCVEDVSILKPFVSIRGNNDYDPSLPNQRIIELLGHRFLLVHGHRHLTFDYKFLKDYAKENKCDIVLYGHTHIFDVRQIDDIKLINPGSCSHNRDGEEPTYCVIELNHNDIKVIKEYVE